MRTFLINGPKSSKPRCGYSTGHFSVHCNGRQKASASSRSDISQQHFWVKCKQNFTEKILVPLLFSKKKNIQILVPHDRVTPLLRLVRRGVGDSLCKKCKGLPHPLAQIASLVVWPYHVTPLFHVSFSQRFWFCHCFLSKILLSICSRYLDGVALVFFLHFCQIEAFNSLMLNFFLELWLEFCILGVHCFKYHTENLPMGRVLFGVP